MSAGRVHSRYVRRLADTAIGGQTTAIDLEVRRFFCDNGDCGQKTFAEQVEGLTFRYGRRTVLLQQALEQVALTLGGKAGERLATRLSMPISGSTLLRLIRRLKLPPVPKVEVLGVDEFAFRRGRRFGTILINMATRRPVDVLPDHTADTFADWLQGREHVQTICRDRGGSFAEGAQRALPGVPQVADRWPTGGTSCTTWLPPSKGRSGDTARVCNPRLRSRTRMNPEKPPRKPPSLRGGASRRPGHAGNRSARSM